MRCIMYCRGRRGFMDCMKYHTCMYIVCMSLSLYIYVYMYLSISISVCLYRCMVTFGGSHGLVRNWGTKCMRSMPTPKMTNIVWGAGLSFAKCHAERKVPYDPHIPHIFDGEEYSRALRFWTYGYDIYSPHRVYILHNYQGSQVSYMYTHYIYVHTLHIYIYIYIHTYIYVYINIHLYNHIPIFIPIHNP